LCGGGAKFLGDDLPQLFDIDVRLLQNSQFSNTNGYYKLGVYSVRKNRAAQRAKQKQEEEKKSEQEKNEKKDNQDKKKGE
jgi:hypothetical protein